MGLCHGKLEGVHGLDSTEPPHHNNPRRSLFNNSPAVGNSLSAKYAPFRLFKQLFPPPSPAKHIRSLLAKRCGSVNPEATSIPECDKNLGFSKKFTSIYELREEVGRGNFGFTCSAKVKKGTLKGQEVAVKVIPKSKLTTAISIEDVRREVEILRALTGHKNLVKFYDAYEDEEKVYIVMEWCQGGELLDRILARGGKYSEEDAKNVMVQILTAVSFCHLQGIVHRGLTFENIVYTTKSEDSFIKVISFGLSDYVSLDERLNDIVGSTYYVAPEVLHRTYGTEADMWSIGVLAYILLSGSRPFWAPTESGIFRSVLKEDPNFEETQWPSLSPESIDFVKSLLHKDYRKRFTAAQALSHPWLAGHPDVKIPLDMIIYRLVKTYIFSSSLRKSALRALGKTLTETQLSYLKKQFNLLGPSKTGFITMQNFKMAAAKNSTDAMKHSRILDYASTLSSIQYRKLDFEEFCGAAISVHQLKGTANWEEHARRGFEVFEKQGNIVIKIEELASELRLSPSIPAHAVLQEWIRHADGKLNFLGFVRLVRGVSSRAMIQKA